MKSSCIRLRGVRQNNLKGFDLDLPLGRYIVVTGLSGAGKSSLVFDTLHAEGQRRYVETFSAYTRQFLDLLDKPKVDSIENIRPSIAIAQTNTVKTSRSTVGTMTELTDFAKVWFSHVAECFDPATGEKVEDDNPQTIWEKTAAAFPGATLLIAFQVKKPANLSWAEILTNLKGQGYSRVLAPAAPARAPVEDGSLSVRKRRKKSGDVAATAPSVRVSSRTLAVGRGKKPADSAQSTAGRAADLQPQLPTSTGGGGAAALHKIEDLLAGSGGSQISNLKSQIHVVQDRLRISADIRSRFLEATETAMHYGAGEVVLFAEANSTVTSDQGLGTSRSEPDAAARSMGLPTHEPTSATPSLPHKSHKVPSLRFGKKPPSGTGNSQLGTGASRALVTYHAVGHFSRGLHSPKTGRTFRPATPALFSFNSPLGACPKCRGFGRVIDIDYRLAIPDHSLSLAEGAIRPWEGEVYGESKRDLLQFAKKVGLPVDVPFAALTEEQKAFVIDGSPGYDGETRHWPQYWYGLKGFFRYLEKTTYKMHVRVFLSRYRAYNPCPDCHGARLQPEALCWRWRGRTLPELYQLPVSELLRMLAGSEAPPVTGELVNQLTRRQPAAPNHHSSHLALDSILTRLRYLEQVGLGYLTLDRSSRTLSGGEVERVNLTSCLGTSLVDTLFVLDEPSVGLHPRDIDRLIGIIRTLTDAGNTVVVVEHDEAMIRAADHVVEVGPAPGAGGGEIVFQGTVDEMLAAKQSITGAYFSGQETIPVPAFRRPVPSSMGLPTHEPTSVAPGNSQISDFKSQTGGKAERRAANPRPRGMSLQTHAPTSVSPSGSHKPHNVPSLPSGAQPPQPTGNPQLGTTSPAQSGNRNPQSAVPNPQSSPAQSPITGHKSPSALGALRFTNASKHNIRNLSFDLPLGRFVCLSGVSGSGKSTLLDNVIHQGLLAQRGLMTEDPASIEALRYYSAAPVTSDQGLVIGADIGKRRAQSTSHNPPSTPTTPPQQSAQPPVTSHKSPVTQHNIGAFVADIVLVDQSPLSRTPRSNPALYCEAWDLIRELYAATPAAQEAGLSPSSFSFNSGDGRCDHCQGLGSERVEMQFLSDVFVPCPICEGKRFKPEVLAIQWNGRSVADLLNTTVSDAIRFFGEPADEVGQTGPSLRGSAAEVARGVPDARENASRGRVPPPRNPKPSQISNLKSQITTRLRPLEAVGLGYLTLGQPLNTLSGGESQRLKLVRYLGDFAGAPETARVEEKSSSLSHSAAESPSAAPADLKLKLPTSTGLVEQQERASGALLLLDEPTTGLHRHDVKRLLDVLQRIVDRGHSLVVIEHNLDVLKSADWIIEIGPDAGVNGGQVIAAGPPELVAQGNSATSPFLAQALEGATAPVEEKSLGLRKAAGGPRPRGMSLQTHAPVSVTPSLSHESYNVPSLLSGSTPPQPTGNPQLGTTPLSTSALVVTGARENNLKNISVTIPHRQLSVVTGVSGSGKSTLAFDIIFAEGQRRFMESMSPYARQFVEQLPRPDIDRLTGIPPTVAIEQRVTRGSRKSTVATITEVAQYLRLLYARLGRQHHPDTGRPVTPLSPGQLRELLARTLDTPAAKKAKHLYLCAPLIRGRKGHHEPIARWIEKHGYPLMRADGRLLKPETFTKLDRYKEHDIEVVVADLKNYQLSIINYQSSTDADRQKAARSRTTAATRTGRSVEHRPSSIDNRQLLGESLAEAMSRGKVAAAAATRTGRSVEHRPSTIDNRQFLGESLAEALRLGKGTAFLLTPQGEILSWFSTTRTDVETGESFPELDPKHFSFNSPRGWCPTCRGHGRIFDWMLQPDDDDEEEQSEEVRDALRTFDPDEPVPHGRPCPTCHGERLNRIARAVRLPLRVDADPRATRVTSDQRLVTGGKSERRAVGRIIPDAPPSRSAHPRPAKPDPQDSARLKTEHRPLIIDNCASPTGEAPGISLPQLLRQTAPELIATLRQLDLDERGRLITQDIIPQIEERLRFLAHVGLDYLSLDRPTETLSGGEAQRIRLAAQLGSNLSGVLYVLDEPSIGLHARDNDRLTDTLASLRDKGNTLLVVEHDDVVMERADRIIDLGPGAGVHGGEVLASATPEEIKKDAASLTGLFLAKGIAHPIRGSYRPVGASASVEDKSLGLRKLELERPTALVGARSRAKTKSAPPQRSMGSRSPQAHLPTHEPTSAQSGMSLQTHAPTAVSPSGSHKSHNVPSLPSGTSPTSAGSPRLATDHRQLIIDNCASPTGSAPAPNFLTLTDITHRNLRHQSLTLPLGRLVMVCGPSGAGKSTLFRDILHPAVAAAIKSGKRKLTGKEFLKLSPDFEVEAEPLEPSVGEGGTRPPDAFVGRRGLRATAADIGRRLIAKVKRANASRGRVPPSLVTSPKSLVTHPFEMLTLGEHFKGVIEVDQSPIGKTPRSTPATYLGIFDLIRQFFASLPESKLRGYTASRFSFNVPGGRCEACAGAGRVKLEMAFMADSYLPCDACGGTRFGPELADITWKGKTIGDVLKLSFDEAIPFFDFHSQLSQVCQLMADCGLGYLTLGQSSPTLSGGEAQRLKLVTELTRGLASYRERSRGIAVRNLYLLEEPTIGLHLSDCERLIKVLHNLVDQGHTVVVIEHHLDLLAEADWIIELGPGGGPHGGHILYQGPLAGLLDVPDSPTAPYLRSKVPFDRSG